MHDNYPQFTENGQGQEGEEDLDLLATPIRGLTAFPWLSLGVDGRSKAGSYLSHATSLDRLANLLYLRSVMA